MRHLTHLLHPLLLPHLLHHSQLLNLLLRHRLPTKAATSAHAIHDPAHLARIHTHLLHLLHLRQLQLLLLLLSE